MIGLPSFVKSISASLVVIITNNLLKVLGGDSALGVFAIVSRLYAALEHAADRHRAGHAADGGV